MFNLFIQLAGLIIGLGAVTVIDWLGFLGRKSNYWTEATTRAHKVTKPLIWIGTTLAIIGFTLRVRETGFLTDLNYIQILLFTIMILNGIFLSFHVSPYLLKQEKAGKANELLPQTLQTKITISFLISFVSWWTQTLVLAYQLTN